MNGKCCICQNEIQKMMEPCPRCHDDPDFAHKMGWLETKQYAWMNTILNEWREESHCSDFILYHYSRTDKKLVVASIMPGVLIGVRGRMYKKYKYLLQENGKWEFGDPVEEIEMLDCYNVRDVE